MNSHQHKYKAFTMAELVTVIAIIAAMVTMATSAILSYYRTSIMDSELRSIQANLQRARQLSISNDSGSDYSVKFLNDSYVLFPGTTYNPGGSKNKAHTLSTNVLVSSTYTNDIVTFSNFTGRTGLAGSVTLTAFGMVKDININSLGIVENID